MTTFFGLMFVVTSLLVSNVLLPAVMWKTRRVKVSLFTYYAVFILYITISFMAATPLMGTSSQDLQLLTLLISLPLHPVCYWIFRGYAWQVTFMLSMLFMCSMAVQGNALYIAANWFSGAAYPLVTVSILIVIIGALALPPLIYFCKRLCLNPEIKNAGIWKFIWVIPIALFIIIMLTGNSFLITDIIEGFGFIFIRLVVYGLLLLICYILDSALRQVSDNIKLTDNARMMETQLAIQRGHYERMMENAEAVKEQRHDLRHQLAVIRQYNESGESGRLGEYIDELTAKIPMTDDGELCGNFAVNAVARHYNALAESAGIKTSFKLAVPAKTGRVQDSDLGIIVGNLIENAIEACNRMTDDERFIRINACIKHGTLIFTVDNSFDGILNEHDGLFYSRKREDDGSETSVGHGLASVRAVAEKYDGDATFEARGNVFMSSVSVEMGDGLCVGG